MNDVEEALRAAPGVADNFLAARALVSRIYTAALDLHSPSTYPQKCRSDPPPPQSTSKTPRRASRLHRGTIFVHSQAQRAAI